MAKGASYVVMENVFVKLVKVFCERLNSLAKAASNGSFIKVGYGIFI